jgi:hypothetical protein
MPLVGSRKIASIKEKARRAIFRSVLTQYLRSSTNSGRKTASRLSRLKTDLAAQLFDRHGRGLFSQGSKKRCEQPLGVPRRSQKMGRFEQARQLGCRDHSHAFPAPPLDKNDLAVLGDLIQKPGQILASVCIGRLNSHGNLLSVQLYCTLFRGLCQIR